MYYLTAVKKRALCNVWNTYGKHTTDLATLKIKIIHIIRIKF